MRERLGRYTLLLALLLGLCCAAAASAGAEAVALPPGLQVPAAAVPGPAFDVDAATDAYLGLLSDAQRAQSDAYFEGGYWLELWSSLWLIGSCLLLLGTGVSTRLRRWSEARSHSATVRLWLYAVLVVALLLLLALPLDFYAGFVREHRYGMSNQTAAAWFGDWSIGTLLSLVFLPFLFVLIYRLLQRGSAQWWLLAGGVAFVITILVSVVAPVFVAPLFNDYKPLPAGVVRDELSGLARANLIPTDNLVYFDASRQTKRISANVSGMLGTARVSLNDNLLRDTSLPEIRAVMGHEMGHYALNHGWRQAVYLSLLFTLMFAAMHWLWERRLAGLITRIGIRGRADVAGAPLAIALFVLLSLLVTPLRNRIIYMGEAEADLFGLNAASEPHGFATVAIRLAAYRKLHPSALEELLFYDHPSGYTRVRGAMLWLQEHPQAAAAR